MLFWTNPRSSTRQNSSCTVTYFTSCKTCSRSKNELITYVLRWTSTLGHTSVGWPAKTYIHQLCVDSRCRLEDLPRAMTDRDWWRDREAKKYVLSVRLDDDDDDDMCIEQIVRWDELRNQNKVPGSLSVIFSIKLITLFYHRLF